MGFNPGGGGSSSIAGSNDVLLNNPAQGEALTYDAAQQKWENTAVSASDPELTTIAGLTPADNDILQRKSGAWAARTPAQLKTDLAIAPGDVTGLTTSLESKAPITDARFSTVETVRLVNDATLSLAHAGKIIEADSAIDMTITVPPSASVPWTDGTIIEVSQFGDGRVTLAPGAGVTLRNPHGLRTSVKYGSLSLRKRPGGSGSVPTADLLLRLKADDIAGANGSAVTAWPDSSGNGHPAATPLTVSNQPTLLTNSLNGHKTVSFDGGNDFLTLSGSALSIAQNRSAVMICIAYAYPTVATGTRTMFAISNGISAASVRNIMYHRDTGGLLGAGGRRLDANSGAFLSGAASVAGQAEVSTAVFDYANSDLYLYKNGTLSNSNTNFQTNGNTSDTPSLAATIGSNSAGTADFFLGRIAEILVYGVNDPATRAAVHTYFQVTYGISMADALGTADEWHVIGDAIV